MQAIIDSALYHSVNGDYIIGYDINSSSPHDTYLSFVRLVCLLKIKIRINSNLFSGILSDLKAAP